MYTVNSTQLLDANSDRGYDEEDVTERVTEMKAGWISEVITAPSQLQNDKRYISHIQKR